MWGKRTVLGVGSRDVSGAALGVFSGSATKCKFVGVSKVNSGDAV